MSPSNLATVPTRNSQPSRIWLDWLPAAVLPGLVWWMFPRAWPAWALMWSLAVALYAGLKCLTWRRSDVVGAPWWQHAGYLVAWPGLDADAFLSQPNRTAVDRPSPAECWMALASLLAGAILFWGVVPRLALGQVLAAGWVGFASILLMLHFGSFQLFCCAWRMVGVRAAPLMNQPFLSESVSEFWGRRWNTAFRDLTHKHLFRRLASRAGAKWALAIGFVFSGLIHELVISVPARGGYGGPTLFFLIQAVAMFAERSAWGKKLGLGRGWRGWLFTATVLVGPAWLLFHPPFVGRVVVPFVLSLTASSFEGIAAMEHSLATLIFIAGIGQLGVLVASALVPIRLKWREEFKSLSRLHRQMYWVYGGYVVLSIIALGLLSVFNSEALASGNGLARGICAYMAVFWGIRLSLQTVLDVKPFLVNWWLKAGYAALTVLFLYFATVFTWAALHPAAI